MAEFLDELNFGVVGEDAHDADIREIDGPVEAQDIDTIIVRGLLTRFGIGREFEFRAHTVRVFRVGVRVADAIDYREIAVARGEGDWMGAELLGFVVGPKLKCHFFAGADGEPVGGLMGAEAGEDAVAF